MADDLTQTARDAQEALERQIAQMKREIGKINRALAERAEAAGEDALGWYNGAGERASKASRALRSQAQHVSEAVRENPGTVSSAMVLGGIVGFSLGWLFSHTASDSHRHWY
jgi:hypothetical protein